MQHNSGNIEATERVWIEDNAAKVICSGEVTIRGGNLGEIIAESINYQGLNITLSKLQESDELWQLEESNIKNEVRIRGSQIHMKSIWNVQE